MFSRANIGVTRLHPKRMFFMSYQGYRSANSLKAKTRNERARAKKLRSQEVSRRCELLIKKRCADHLTWWNTNFRSSLMHDWIFSQSRSLWASLHSLLGLAPSRNSSFSFDILNNSFSSRLASRYDPRRMLCYEALEQRQLLAGDLDASLDGSGNLTIADLSLVANNNSLTVSRSDSNLTITDAATQFSAAPAGGSLSNGGKTLTIPLSSVTGKLILSTGLGNDVVNVDFSGGQQFPQMVLSSMEERMAVMMTNCD